MMTKRTRLIVGLALLLMLGLLAYGALSTEQSITILNPKEYPSLGENWTIYFNTTGSGTLEISDHSFPVEVDFVGLYRKDGDVWKEVPVIIDGNLISADWSFDQTKGLEGRAIFKVLTTGSHTLEFRFGNVAYAKNQATLTQDAVYCELTLAGTTTSQDVTLVQTSDDASVTAGNNIDPGVTAMINTSHADETLPTGAILDKVNITVEYSTDLEIGDDADDYVEILVGENSTGPAYWSSVFYASGSAATQTTDIVRTFNVSSFIDTTTKAEHILISVVAYESAGQNANLLVDHTYATVWYHETEPPAFNNPGLSDTEILQGESVELWINITDNAGVAASNFTIKYPNGTLTNFSASQKNGTAQSGYWNYTFDDTDQAGTYNWTNAYANDTSNNWNSTEVNLEFTVLPLNYSAHVSVYDTIGTSDITDDTLVGEGSVETGFNFTDECYYNNSVSIADVVIGSSTVYRVIVQIRPDNANFDVDGDLGGETFIHAVGANRQINDTNTTAKELNVSATLVTDEGIKIPDIACAENDSLWTPNITAPSTRHEYGLITTTGDPDSEYHADFCENATYNIEAPEVTGGIVEQGNYTILEFYFQVDDEWSVNEQIELEVVAGADSGYALAGFHFNLTAVTVAAPVIDVTVSNIPILFGNLNPNTQDYPAPDPVNVTIHGTTNVAWNLSIKGDVDFAATWPLDHLEFSNDSTNVIYDMTISYQGPDLFDDWNTEPDPTADVYRLIYFEINVPEGQLAKDYSTQVYINVTQAS